jgi:hypothetical protein
MHLPFNSKKAFTADVLHLTIVKIEDREKLMEDGTIVKRTFLDGQLWVILIYNSQSKMCKSTPAIGKLRGIRNIQVYRKVIHIIAFGK